MGKSTHPVPIPQKSTSPQTRVIDASRAGQAGSVQAAPQPVGTPQKQPHSVDYAQRVPADANAMPDGNRTSLQQPSDVKVETEK